MLNAEALEDKAGIRSHEPRAVSIGIFLCKQEVRDQGLPNRRTFIVEGTSTLGGLIVEAVPGTGSAERSAELGKGFVERL